MTERPCLEKRLDAKTFCSFYYLKEELVDFCRANGLPAGGSKAELTERIALYLDTGRARAANPAPRPRARSVRGEITESTFIEPDFVCSEKHRAFFKEKLGNGFSFNVSFQKWLKANAGKTYAQALKAYEQIRQEKKTGKTMIGAQFEYNAYIRAFFAANPGKTLPQAIRCWNYKKGLRGHHRYEAADLAALE